MELVPGVVKILEAAVDALRKRDDSTESSGADVDSLLCAPFGLIDLVRKVRVPGTCFAAMTERRLLE